MISSSLKQMKINQLSRGNTMLREEFIIAVYGLVDDTLKQLRAIALG